MIGNNEKKKNMIDTTIVTIFCGITNNNIITPALIHNIIHNTDK